MTAYEVTPVGALGRIPSRTRVVIGPEIGGTSPPDLHRQIGRLIEENDDLRRKAELVEEITRRWEDEAANRVKAQIRLNHAMRVIAVISQLCPPLRPVIDRARKDIWGE